MTTDNTKSNVGSAPAEGQITDEAIENAKAMIGLQLRPEGPYLQDASPDTLRNWCNGIGDLNPLYRDPGYGHATRYATQLGHPMFPMAYGWLGRKYVKDNAGLVDIELAAVNQRGEVTTPGLATVALPSRDVNQPAFVDGSGCNLDLPVVR